MAKAHSSNFPTKWPRSGAMFLYHPGYIATNRPQSRSAWAPRSASIASAACQVLGTRASQVLSCSPRQSQMSVRGKLQTWRRDNHHWDMQLDIERGAGLTVEENEQHGPKIVRWSPHPQTAVLSSAARAPAAELQLAGR